MNDEEFERSIRALREEGDRPAPQARLTKERVLADLRPKARRRRATWLIPVAALLAGSTVLAATGRLPEAFHAAARALGFEGRNDDTKDGPAKAPAARALAPVAKPASTSAETAPSAEPPALAPANDDTPAIVGKDAGTAAHRRAKTHAALASPAGTSLPSESPPSPAQSATTGAASPASDDQGTLSLYRRARQLHFAEQNPAAALAAWDAYLAAEPRGPLSVDARYNRALCLVRLGRKQEARAALEPFAAGKYGSYRQSEARALLDAMP